MNQQSALLTSPSQKNEPAQRSVRSRLRELLKLKDGWLNGAGKALPEAGVEQFANSLEKYYHLSFPVPCLFPTFDGNLQAEWAVNDFDVSLNIDLSNQSAFYHASSNKNEETDEAVLNLAQPSGWQQLAQKLTALSKD